MDRLPTRPDSSRARRRLVFALSVGILIDLVTPFSARATTIAYRTDAELVAISDRVIHGRVLSVDSRWSDERQVVYTIARIAVLEDFTGIAGSIVEVEALGGLANGVRVSIHAAPRFVTGQDVILCLETTSSGRYRSVAMGFSTFDVMVRAGGEVAAVRQVSDSAVLGAPTADVSSRSPADFRRVVGAVKGVRSLRPVGRPEGLPPQKLADKHVAQSSSSEDLPAADRFTLLGNGIRWNEIDNGTSIRWYRNADTPATLSSGNVDTLIEASLQAWTAPSTAQITLAYGGTKSLGGQSPYCTPANAGSGLITFEDPTNELGNGVLAVGGGCSTTVGGKTINGTPFWSFSHGFVVFNNAGQLGASYQMPTNFSRVLTHEIGHGIGLGHTQTNQAGANINLMYPSCCHSGQPVPPAIGPDDLAGIQFIYPSGVADEPVPPPTTDTDADGVPDAWEVRFGLNPNSSIGDDGGSGDPDADGLVNSAEFQHGTHPRGFFRRYLAEGAASSFFATTIALVNPSASTTGRTLVRFQTSSGAVLSEFVEVPPLSRRTVSSGDVAGLSGQAFSSVIESDVDIISDRTMSWDGSGYGSHTETSVASPATTWFLAEGATHSGFDLFYLIQNPSDSTAYVEVTYLLPAPQLPVVKAYQVAADSRFTIWVDQEDARLTSVDVSAVLTAINGVPIIVERAMYLNSNGQAFGAGHGSAGVTAPALHWFLAEGATGWYFDLFVLLANPQPQVADVTIRYLLPDSRVVTRQVAVAPLSRQTIWVDQEDAALANTAVSTEVSSTVPLIVERAMWWPGPTSATWLEAHNSPGATTTTRSWAVADGAVGGIRSSETYLLLANTTPNAATVKVTLVFENLLPEERTFLVPANSRFNVDVRREFPSSAVGQRFGALVDSLTPNAPIVVERAIYWNANGVSWAAGSDSLATRR